MGDVVPIDGMVPETLETWEHDGHVLLTLRDASGNIAKSADNGGDEWIRDLEEQNESIQEQIEVFRLRRDAMKERYGAGTME